MTKRVKRKFSPDFRTEIARMVLEGGQTASAVARAHDLAPSLVAHWARQARTDAGQGLPGALSTSEREELSKARRDLRDLRRENEFLKKTAAWFASQGR